ncbi:MULTISPECIES: hypothetical protein [unclassified Pseudoclavibacter]|uniref:hypothetical protein n=1 Tax=unclassified Pseudoclavibacter TaxID=2615177 RepID=UPI001BA503A0|nr:hypothetical protein [Pseudoclavibacter sp. Marseille-Q4354]MBS3177196.1 hypothetical protein [Pseudoclavibacter sp. Marseille-Q4354]
MSAHLVAIDGLAADPEFVALCDHLFDGEPLILPHAYLGHEQATSPAAHAHVSLSVVNGQGVGLTRHPYNGRYAVSVEDQGHQFWASVDRLAHDMACEECWTRLWVPMSERAAQAGPGEGIYGLADLGSAVFSVDAEDLR